MSNIIKKELAESTNAPGDPTHINVKIRGQVLYGLNSHCD